MVEEGKIVNESMACLSQEGDPRGLKNADSLNKS